MTSWHFFPDISLHFSSDHFNRFQLWVTQRKKQNFDIMLCSKNKFGKTDFIILLLSHIILDSTINLIHLLYSLLLNVLESSSSFTNGLETINLLCSFRLYNDQLFLFYSMSLLFCCTIKLKKLSKHNKLHHNLPTELSFHT